MKQMQWELNSNVVITIWWWRVYDTIKQATCKHSPLKDDELPLQYCTKCGKWEWL